MNAQYLGKEANKDGSFKYWFNVDGKEIGITEGGENGGHKEDREGNDAANLDNMFLAFEITDEMREEAVSDESAAEVVSTESAKDHRDVIFAEMQTIHAGIMAKYEQGIHADELREKFDLLEREFRMLCDE